MAAATWEPDCPLLATSADRIVQSFARAGLDYRTGLKLVRIYPGGTAPTRARDRRRDRRPAPADRCLGPEAAVMTARREGGDVRAAHADAAR